MVVFPCTWQNKGILGGLSVLWKKVIKPWEASSEEPASWGKRGDRLVYAELIYKSFACNYLIIVTKKRYGNEA